MCRSIFILFLCFYSGRAVIHHLNVSEYARMPPLFGLDQFDRCLVPNHGLFCVFRMDLFSRDNGSLINLIHEYSENTLKHYNHTYIQRGVCVTDTCKHHIKNNSLYSIEGLIQTLEGCLNESIYTEYGIEAKLTQLYYCEKKGQQIEVDVWDWTVLGIYIAVAVVNVVATLYDYVISKSNTAVKGNPYITSFSLIQNWKRLVSPESEETRAKRLTGLHGIKVLTLFLMFIAHVIFFNSMGFNDNIQQFEEFYENPYYQNIFNGMVVIQIFFVISGFLLAYNLEVYSEKRVVSWGMALKIGFMRFWRLTPSYAMMIFFMSTLVRHVGSGPLWRLYVADTIVPDCRKYWWTHLLYFNNYLPKEHICAIHTWHIAADTQLFCVGLVVYLVTRSRGRAVALATLVTLGVVLPALHVWLRDLDALVLMTPETYRSMINDTFFFLHMYGHNNLASYAIGMATAGFVYKMQKKGFLLADNKMCQVLAWLVVPAVIGVLYSGRIFYIDDWKCPLLLKLVYAALHRFTIGVIIAFVVMALALRLNSYIRAFFEWNIWLVPSRLSYTVYLLHLLLIQVLMGIKHQLGHVSTLNMTVMHFGILMSTFMVSLPFSLMVEAPIMRLLRVKRSSEEQTKF